MTCPATLFTASPLRSAAYAGWYAAQGAHERALASADKAEREHGDECDLREAGYLYEGVRARSTRDMPGWLCERWELTCMHDDKPVETRIPLTLRNLWRVWRLERKNSRLEKIRYRQHQKAKVATR